MGSAMLEGWLHVGLPGAAATVLDPQPSADLMQICDHKGVALNPARDTIAPPAGAGARDQSRRCSAMSVRKSRRWSIPAPR